MGGMGPPPDLWLLFAPLERVRADWIVEKACELGCRRLLPVLTERTGSRRLPVARLRARATEMAAQCGLLSVPDVAAPAPLAQVLDTWSAERRLLFCDERRRAPPAQEVLAKSEGGAWAVLVGPEGGFTPAEAARIASHPQAVPISLGPRLLRADTAMIAALSLWQSALGDWREGA